MFHIFQSTLPQGERPCNLHAQPGSSRFQSTLPQGERLESVDNELKPIGFQSTLPQGERQGAAVHPGPGRAISIHAPTRGATRECYCYMQDCKVFQSTLPQGERPVCGGLLGALGIFQSTLPQGERPYIQNQTRHFVYFNPRSHKGSDGTEYEIKFGNEISIHAPTRGATPYNAIAAAASEFQSTLPQGERRCTSLGAQVQQPYFNPRSHKGSDRTPQLRWHYKEISIHAPTRGATTYTSIYQANAIISIHAPTRGATPGRNYRGCRQRFQSTLPQGERLFLRIMRLLMANFNPRSHKGSDLGKKAMEFYGNISIHAPTRGATVQTE